LRRLFFALLALLLTPTLGAIKPDVISSTGAIPANIAGRFREATGFQQSASGQYFVFDRGAHSVFGVDAAHSGSWEIIQIGAEAGRIIDPTAFSVAPDGTFVVADAPRGRARIQIFTPVGFPLGAFGLPSQPRSRIMLGNFVLNGIGSLQYTGHSILLSQPEYGALITEYATNGTTLRSFGALRATSHEDDRDLHLALNSGVPLVDPTGGFFFVFQAGVPHFRKYDSMGNLLFERRMEGQEIDGFVRDLPTTWTKRRTAEGELPVVSPTIRAAAVDASGRLWVTFVLPYTYVYDQDGDKVRTVQFRAAGIVTPNSLFFAKNGRLLVTPGLYEFDTDPR